MSYSAEKVLDGLRIHDVIMSKVGTYRGIDLTQDIFNGFIKNFDARVADGYDGAFVLLRHGGSPVGRIEALSSRDGLLLGRLLIYNEQVAKLIEEKRLKDISITWFQDEQILMDVSLLDNVFAQLYKDIPPLKVDIINEFKLNNINAVTHSVKFTEYSHHNKDAKMEFSPEALEQLAGLIGGIVDAKLDAQKPASDELEAEIEATANKKVEALEAKLKSRERELEINSYVASLMHKTGNAYGEKTLRKIFEEIKTDEGRKIKFEGLMSTSDHQASLAIEQNYSKPSVEKALAIEFEAKGGEKYFGISQAKYVSMSIARNITADLK